MRRMKCTRLGSLAVFLALFLTGGTAFAQNGFGQNGYITDWLILGPFSHNAPACPQPADFMNQDFLTDGDITQEEVCAKEGDEIETDCGGAAACTGYLGRDGTPTWLAWKDDDGGIDYDTTNPVFWTVDNAMAYAVTYVTSPEEMEVYFAVGSDDATEVWFDDTSIGTNPNCAPWGWPTPQVRLGPVTLMGGQQHRIMTKCFDAGGEWRFFLRIEDESRTPITDQTHDIEVTTEDITWCGDVVPPTPKATRDLPPARPSKAPGLVTIDVEEKEPEVKGKVVITETPPAGWKVTDITPAPKSSNGDIVWEVDGDALPVTLSYKVKAPRCGTGCFGGTIEWKDAGTDYKKGIGGDRCFGGGCFGPDGYITDWLILGPIGDQGGCDIGPAEINADYLTDGVETQAEVLPYPDLQIEIDFGAAENAGDIYYGRTVDDIPAWYAIYDNDGGINYNDEHMPGMQNDNVMAYAICYVTNTTDADMEDVWIGTGSDDALEFWFDDQVWTIDACRGWGWPNPQDTNGPVTLLAGVQHRIMTKTFEQGGGWNFYLRFQDAGGAPITDGLEVSLEPYRPLKVERSFSSASYKPGDTVTTTLTLLEVVTPPPAAVRIVETIPAGWTATTASDSGSIQGQTITWNLTGAAIASGKTVTYQMPAPKGITATFSGTFEVEGTTMRVKELTTLPRAPIPEENLSPWIAADIGTPLKGGQEKISENSFNIWGGGADIASRSDSFRFIHKSTSGGDLTMWVRVDAQEATGAGAKAGLMVRQSLEPGSPFYFVQATPNDGAGPRYRTSLNGNAGPAMPISAKVALPLWLKLDRKANSFTAFTSTDGTTWEQNFRTATHKNPRSLTLTEPVLYGFAVTAGDADKVSGVMFRDFQCQGPGCLEVPPRPGFHRGDIDGTGGLTIGDAIFLLNYQFAGGATPPCLDACDTDDSGTLTIGDPIYLLGYMFAGGPAPPAPGPPGSPCGPDTTGVPLGCESYPPAACR